MASLLPFVVLLYFVQGVESTANLVLLTEAATNEGAVCLDGTPGGYYLRPAAGTGSGTMKWILHLEGGEWCFGEDACLVRSTTSLGSSKNWPRNATYGGLLSANETVNPDFHDWNVAFLKYCDGALFSGEVNHPVDVAGTKIYFRGKRLLRAALDDLSSKGLKSATEVILTGCSGMPGGGLATYLHADYVRSYLSPQVSLKAIADAGYFLDARNWMGEEILTPRLQQVFKMQNCSGGVNQDCILAHQKAKWKCFFAQYTVPFIKTPLFQYNSLYDTWQIVNVLQLDSFPNGCSDYQKEAVLNYRQEFLDDSVAVNASKTSGMFLPACLEHCMSLNDTLWTKIKVGGMTAVEAISKWYFGSGPLHLIDCAWPCNPTCPDKTFNCMDTFSKCMTL